MATNQASQFSADISNYIAEKTLPLARKQLVAYQFGDPLRLPKGFGTTYTATLAAIGTAAGTQVPVGATLWLFNSASGNVTVNHSGAGAGPITRPLAHTNPISIS